MNRNSPENPELPSLGQLVAEIRARGPSDSLRRRGTQQFDTAFAQGEWIMIRPSSTACGKP
jgi:hypothetical protein